MTAETWLDDNNRYLAVSLQWLRLKLQRLAGDGVVDEPQRATIVTDVVVQQPEQPGSTPPARRSWFSFGEGVPSGTAPPARMQALPLAASSPQAAGAALDEAITEAAAQRTSAAQAEPPPALLMLAQRIGLTAFEADTLLLCAALELDPGMAALIGAAHGQGAPASPTFGLALQLFDEPSWDALSPHRPLRYAYLLDITQPGATPLTAAALRADERIVHYLKGLNALDERLSTMLLPLDAGVAGAEGDDGEGKAEVPLLAASQQRAADEACRQLQAVGQNTPLPLVALLGRDPASQRDLALAVGQTLGRDLYRLPLDALPTARTDLDSLARLWQRECLLLPIALYVDASELASAPAELAAAFHSFVARPLGLVFVGLREAPARPLSHAVAIDVDRPTTAEQHQAWVQALQGALPPEDAARLAAPLASQFDLGLRDIERAMAVASVDSGAVAGDGGRPNDTGDKTSAPAQGTATLADRVWAACCQQTRPRLDQLAQRIDARATWADLVLADEPLALLRRIAQQVQQRFRVYEDWGYARKMNRGLGISALFAGESGTGKTMAAEVIANELKLGLYRIDLSAVVSKFIGETEKNLRRLFDAAEQGGAILLFDEADALFGKRSEVKDSHDRYANIEINYLLQRMEAFSGLAILATNMKSALDAAFLRRLRFVVNFQYPGVPERKRMWQQALPDGVPRDPALDFDRLARFNFSGGNIHSIALNAAFAAAAQGGPVTQAALLSAVRSELRKLDKPIHEGEFR
jgi:ATPase family associated with various cellular activities (AAA)